ncbi:MULTISPECIES: hypothetical protein [Rhodococcus]|uniref:hypothetical protein n=1 Tax=Rhodococcus TaxID=1827 RepID=UPI00143E55FB|nr:MULTISPECIES: hypothetical protein [Rhodococcus]QIX49826.1 hypothetical protein HFP48_09795 [Rhodococcus sp. DMU1]QRI75115.1 hypothetical protein JQ505_21610 [Rhodococcus aetherivorans]QSE58523.1 hypothetical protein JYA75_22715 [Rhodococcus sp. PSBB066]QSE70152.1 hypothetical protein JYA91_04905 [Rhodococcus sp. PSBB049]
MLLAATVLAVAGCGGSGGTVRVQDDPILEAEFDTVLLTGEPRTLASVAEDAGLSPGSWDRMYRFSLPLLMSSINRDLGLTGTVWENLPDTAGQGLIVFMSDGAVVRAAVDRAPVVEVDGYGTPEALVEAAPDRLTIVSGH